MIVNARTYRICDASLYANLNATVLGNEPPVLTMNLPNFLILQEPSRPQCDVNSAMQVRKRPKSNNVRTHLVRDNLP